jgi:hypothetical protein
MIVLMVLFTLMAVAAVVFKLYGQLPLFGLVLGNFVWMWFDTYYQIKQDKLYYRSAWIRGSVPIAAIEEVHKHQKLYSGLRPALSTKGMVIKYNRWDELFISPVEMDLFINALSNINPNIKVVG